MTNDPVPQRLSDADRDQAVDCLRQHYEAGRLSDAEFADRSGKALESRFASEVDALFSDLPDPRPSLGGPQQYRAPGGNPYQAAPGWTQSPASPPPFPQTADPYAASQFSQSPAPNTPYTPANGPQQGQVPAKQETDWIAVGRKALWPIVILGALISGEWGGWILAGVVLTIVFSQLAARTRKPPPY